MHFTIPIKIIYFQEHQIVHNLSPSDNMVNYAKRTDLQPHFIEKLVCSKMEKLNISHETNVIKRDDTLKINDVMY